MIFNWLNRIRHSNGFGVHSPFAFYFITNVIYCKNLYYAYDDIKDLLSGYDISVVDVEFYQLIYRLERYFNPSVVLDVGFENSLNALYTCHSNKDIIYHRVSDYGENLDASRALMEASGINADIFESIPSSHNYDAILINSENAKVSCKDILIDVSSEKSFWVVKGINSRIGAKFWKSIIFDRRFSVTFDKTDIGIAILDNSYKKQNYLI